jgi:signal transduction histidine kinase
VLLFETYSRYSAVNARAPGVFREVALISLGALVLLELVQVPLAWRMARLLSHAQGEREDLLEKAIASSRTERRRIAADLHDGVVQDLAATSFSLAGAAARVEGEARHVLVDAAGTVRSSIRSLRSLLVDIYPPSLHQSGLAAALRDLASSLAGRGITVDVSLPNTLRVADRTAELVYRVAQETLRNVQSHSGARAAALCVERRAGALVLTVADDGIGFDPGAVAGAPQPGHVGLMLLRDLTHDSGASLTITSERGHGTHVRLEVPDP